MTHLNRSRLPIVLIAALALLVSGCRNTPTVAPPDPTATTLPLTPTATLSPLPAPTFSPISPLPAPPATLEPEVTVIELAGPLTAPKAELSGLAWYGDHLILLPQYPDRFDDALFTLSRAEIETALGCGCGGPPAPRPIPLAVEGLDDIRGFEGFEAVAFDGDAIYLTIEAQQGSTMQGYLVAGTIAPDLGEIRLDVDGRVPIPPQAPLDNMTDEALLVAGGALLTFYEANGRTVNPAPVVHRFAQETLTEVASVPFPSIEYRITDVTSADPSGRFWAINYFWPGDTQKLQPAADPLAALYGEGPTHAQAEVVERLVEFHYDGLTITQTERPPLQLTLAEDGEARNWEGLVRLDERGFLLVTDTHPTTLLAFVPYAQP